MLDFSHLTNNLEGDSISNIIIIALTSFVLSSLIALTYQKTSKTIETPRYFIQSLIIISIPVSMVMQAIGDSLARGLGMLGALAIIRFRTTLRNPRNMVFMFTSIAVGIAAGVYGIMISIIGTLAFCIVVWLIHYSPLAKLEEIIGNLQFEIQNDYLEDSNLKIAVEDLVLENTIKSMLTKYNIKLRKRKKNASTEIVSFGFMVKIESREKVKDLVNRLSRIDGISNVTININNDEYSEKI